jgi:DNA-binding IclR family transcriptional regulator
MRTIAAATSREGHRSPRSGRAARERLVQIRRRGLSYWAEFWIWSMDAVVSFAQVIRVSYARSARSISESHWGHANFSAAAIFRSVK